MVNQLGIHLKIKGTTSTTRGKVLPSVFHWSALY